MAFTSATNYINAVFPNLSPVTPFVKTSVAAQQNAKLVSAVSELGAISEQAKKVGSLYENIKKSNDPGAASAFRNTVLSFVKTRDAKALDNFTSLGNKLVESKKTTELGAMMNAAGDIAKLGAPSMVSRFVNTASATYKTQGVEGLSSYVSGASSIANQAEAGPADKYIKITALKNYDTLVNRTVENGKKNGLSTAEVNKTLSGIAGELRSATSLTQAGRYVSGALSAIGGEAEKTTANYSAPKNAQTITSESLMAYQSFMMQKPAPYTPFSQVA